MKFPGQLWHDQISEAENAQANPVFQLQQRIKELNCLYAVIETLQTSRPDLKFEETIRKVLQVIPEGLQHPGRTGVALQVREKRYTTPLFVESDHNLVTVCPARDGARIALHISLQSDNGGSTRPIYLEEEEALLDKIVRLFRRFYHHQLNVTRLAEIHHRVKNNLAVISGLLELEADL